MSLTAAATTHSFRDLTPEADGAYVTFTEPDGRRRRGVLQWRANTVERDVLHWYLIVDEAVLRGGVSIPLAREVLMSLRDLDDGTQITIRPRGETT
ncbi:hypothetical protein GCM10025867_46100 (plasmid) [Frondihabitans sucicola]|uniref:Uncharacterized protein n=1 Tax=Frondihabitans sucicola TaxID=1268041 RepID=A0ABM8GV72_9MICO|nr:hypothetical protein [Frondihabitans sucicola]BDZ52369.1 hypothetical protein GCM10025867_46100 [Frondihabitans sucicola]